MKLRQNISTARHQGILIMECVVYLAVFFILLGVAMGSFYIFWDHSTALRGVTNDISASLRAGERWRADVRAATGNIIVETNSAGVLMTIPARGDKIFYNFHEDAVRRKLLSQTSTQTLLKNVKLSEMEMDLRDGISAWRWEIELKSLPRQQQMPLKFTFQAAKAP